MKALKIHGMKNWNNGWEGRAKFDRAIEKATRRAGHREIEAQLAAEEEENLREEREAQVQSAIEYVDFWFEDMLEKEQEAREFEEFLSWVDRVGISVGQVDAWPVVRQQVG